MWRRSGGFLGRGEEGFRGFRGEGGDLFCI